MYKNSNPNARDGANKRNYEMMIIITIHNSSMIEDGMERVAKSLPPRDLYVIVCIDGKQFG